MPEYRHTQTLQEIDEAQQVSFLARSDQNIVKDAQTQRQVQMIQNMPSDIHSKGQNMLMPGSSEAAVQRLEQPRKHRESLKSDSELRKTS